MNISLSNTHFLRLAFKKFRYVLEVAHPLLEYQSQMGDIQDMEVSLQRMDNIKDSQPDLETVRAFYQGRRAEALTRFMEGKDDLLTFWLAAPDEKFP